MTEELQGALTEILNGILTAKDFMLAELPEVIQQLLLWKFWYYCLHNIVGIVLLIAGVVLAIRYFKKIFKYINDGTSYNMREIAFLPYTIVTVIWFLFAGHCINLVWLKIWIAPKIYLIEYAASLAK